jgi:hypothetical protein
MAREQHYDRDVLHGEGLLSMAAEVTFAVRDEDGPKTRLPLDDAYDLRDVLYDSSGKYAEEDRHGLVAVSVAVAVAAEAECWVIEQPAGVQIIEAIDQKAREWRQVAAGLLELREQLVDAFITR